MEGLTAYLILDQNVMKKPLVKSTPLEFQKVHTKK